MSSQFKLITVLLVISTSLFAQVSNTITSVNFSELKTGNPVEVTAELVNPLSVVNIQIVYKSFQDIDYKVREMEIIGNAASYKIIGQEIGAPLLSYYLVIRLNNGTQETYPQGIPDYAKPIDLTIKDRTEKDNEILILSPAEGETISLDELFISVSLVRVPEVVDVLKSKIILNGEDITSKVTFAGDLLLFYPDNFPGTVDTGPQEMEIKIYDNEGNLYHSSSRVFSAVGLGGSSYLSQKFKYSGSVIGEIRNEYFNTESTLYNNIGLTLNGEMDDWRIRGYSYLTSEENTRLQPQNRYSLTISNDWLYLRGGDSYPRYTDLLLNGKRIRGVDGELDFGAVSLQSSYGQVRRSVEGILLETYTNENTPLISNVIRIDSSKYGNPYGKVEFGLYERDLLSGRLAFGSRNNILIGISFLHSKDDVQSIDFGVKPQENIVAGVDLGMSFDNRNIVIKGEAAMSALNSDITTGSFTDEQIDSIYSSEDINGGDAETFKQLSSAFGSIMTVNQFIEPLNFTELSSLATEGTVELNYFSNNLKGSYIYRGSQFTSFGQEYTRIDVQGFNINDRIRFANNQFLVTLGYENLHDNLQKTKASTTTFQTFRISGSLSLMANAPYLIVGYIRNENSNGVKQEDTLRINVDDVTNRFSANIGYDFDLKVRHNTSLGFMASQRADNGYYRSDADYMSTSFTLNSFWANNFHTFLNAIYYNSEIAPVKYSYVTLSAGGKYKLLNNNLELSLYYSPSYGDFERQSVNFTTSYQLIQNLWLRLQMRYYKLSQGYSNSIAGITVRYNF